MEIIRIIFSLDVIIYSKNKYSLFYSETFIITNYVSKLFF